MSLIEKKEFASLSKPEQVQYWDNNLSLISDAFDKLSTPSSMKLVFKGSMFAAKNELKKNPVEWVRFNAFLNTAMDLYDVAKRHEETRGAKQWINNTKNG